MFNYNRWRVLIYNSQRVYALVCCHDEHDTGTGATDIVLLF